MQQEGWASANGTVKIEGAGWAVQLENLACLLTKSKGPAGKNKNPHGAFWLFRNILFQGGSHSKDHKHKFEKNSWKRLRGKVLEKRETFPGETGYSQPTATEDLNDNKSSCDEPFRARKSSSSGRPTGKISQ